MDKGNTFSYHDGTGFLQTQGNFTAPKKMSTPIVNVEIKIPKEKQKKKPTRVPNPTPQSKKNAQSYGGNPYIPSGANKPKGLMKYFRNRNSDASDKFREKDSKEQEKQTDLLKKLEKKNAVSGSGGFSLGKIGKMGLIGGLAGWMAKGGIVGLFKKLFPIAVIASAFDKGGEAFTKFFSDVGDEAQRIANEKSVDVSELGITSQMRAIVDTVSKKAIVATNSILEAIGVEYKVDENLVANATKEVSEKLDFWGKNLAHNGGEIGMAVVDFLTKANSILGSTTEGIKATEPLLEGMQGKGLTLVKSMKDMVIGGIDILDEFQDLFRKQSVEEEVFRKKLKAYAKVKSGNEIKEAMGIKLTEKDLKEEAKAKKEASRSAKIALNSGMSKESGIYNDAKSLTVPLNKLVSEFKREQDRYGNMTSGISGNGSILGIGGYSKEEILAQKSKRDKKANEMYEYKKANGGLSKSEVRDYNLLKSTMNNKNIGFKEEDLERRKVKQQEIAEELKNLESLKQRILDGSLMAKTEKVLRFSSNEQFEAEIKKKKFQLEQQDKIIKATEKIIKDLKSLNGKGDEKYVIPAPKKTSATRSNSITGLSHSSTMEYEGFRNHIYKDTEGYDTIGYGHKLTSDDKKTGRYANGISKKDAKTLYEKDKSKHNKKLYKTFGWIAKQPDSVREALEDMAYNMGIGDGNKGGLSDFHNTLALIKKGEYKKASKSMLNSHYADQVGQRAIDNSTRIASASNITTKTRVAKKTTPVKKATPTIRLSKAQEEARDKTRYEAEERAKADKSKESKRTKQAPTASLENPEIVGLLKKIVATNDITAKNTKPSDKLASISLVNQSTGGILKV